MVKELLQEYKKNKDKIIKRLEEFMNVSEEDYFHEFLFCLLTPQSNAKKCWQAIEEIKNLSKINKISLIRILKTKTRFHNNKSDYIMASLKTWRYIKKELEFQKDILNLRNLLADNVKGYGLKEASHFLRNIGRSENKIAILDRHILKNLESLGIIKENKVKSKTHYLEIEQKFISFSHKIKIPIDHLDLLFWSKENGEIFK